ncbi:MAG: DUF3592 domain-containing protein [Desulfosarcina sp.]|nr:DUF3592 domain-containing protein [Desulfosarcina sp.]MBC2744878.1 DUF3592 domain-containing protein [Desulfosarcina sp.]MBC2767786.1 DUF3592 domain-containing protein [Desulfosarcina sp.]
MMDNPQVKKSGIKKAGIGCLGIVVFFFALIAIMAALDGWSRYKGGKESLKWPSTEGVILSSEVKTDRGKSDDVDPKHTAAIAYLYTVEGYEYTGERVSFAGQTFLKKSKADSLARRYGKGLRVKVYYDPKTPHVSVLEPGNSSGPPIISFLLVAIIIFALFRGIRFFYRKRRAVKSTSFPSFTPQAPASKPAYQTGSAAAITPSGVSDGKKKSDRTLVIFTFLFPVAGIVVLYFGVNALINGYESRNWPTVQGQISNSYVDRQHKSRPGTTGSSIRYVARIGYEYTINGKTYYCDTIGFGKSEYGSQKRSKALKYLEQYPKGKPVTVYYDPADPHNAVLKAGITGGAMLIMAMGLLFMIVGAASFIALRNHRRRQSAYGQPSP